MRPTRPRPESDWPPSRKLAVVLDLIQEKDTLASLAHGHGLSAATLLAWRNDYLQEALQSAPQTPLLEEIRQLRAKLADLQRH